MITFETISKLESATLKEGDLVQVLGEFSEGDVALMTGKVYPALHDSSNRLVTIANGLKVEVFPTPLGDKDVTKKYVNQQDNKIKEQVNNLHTERDAIEWKAGLRVTDELQLYVKDGIEYLPDSKAVPFTIGSSFDADQWVQSGLITDFLYYKSQGFSPLINVKVGDSVAVGHDLYVIDGVAYPVANPVNSVISTIDIANHTVTTNAGTIYLLDIKYFNRQCVDARSWWLTGLGNETDKLRIMNQFLSSLTLFKKVDFSGLGELTIDRVEIPSNCNYYKANIGFTQTFTSDLDNPLMTGDNYERGVNGHTVATYPTERFSNVLLDKCRFANQESAIVRRQIGTFVAFDNLTIKDCIIDEIGGTGISFFGCILPYPSFVDAYTQLKPHDYSTNLQLVNNTAKKSWFGSGVSFVAGGGFQVAGVMNITLSGNDATDVGAAYLIDFLNDGFLVFNNGAKLVDAQFATVAEPDLIGVYVGQASYRGIVASNKQFYGHKKAIYLEACSEIDVYDNTKVIGNPAVTGTFGIAATPNPLDNKKPNEILAMTGINIHNNSFKDFETPALLGNVLAEDGLEVEFNYNGLYRTPASIQPSVVLAEIAKGQCIGNYGNGYAQFNGVKGFTFSLNTFKSSNYALYIVDDTYNEITGNGNTLITTGSNTCYAANSGGWITLEGGFVGAGTVGVVEGAGNLELIGYRNGGQKVTRQTINVNLAGGASVSGTISISGVTEGDQIKFVALTTGAIISQAYPLSDGEVRYTIQNVSNIAINVSVDFDIYVEKYSSSLYRT